MRIYPACRSWLAVCIGSCGPVLDTDSAHLFERTSRLRCVWKFCGSHFSHAEQEVAGEFLLRGRCDLRRIPLPKEKDFHVSSRVRSMISSNKTKILSRCAWFGMPSQDLSDHSFLSDSSTRSEDFFSDPVDSVPWLDECSAAQEVPTLATDRISVRSNQELHFRINALCNFLGFALANRWESQQPVAIYSLSPSRLALTRELLNFEILLQYSERLHSACTAMLAVEIRTPSRRQHGVFNFVAVPFLSQSFCLPRVRGVFVLFALCFTKSCGKFHS